MAKYLRLLSLQQVIRSPAYHVRHDQQPRIHFFIQRLTKGIAFEAKLSGDGTWHGYPIPWEAVPPEIVREWVTEEKVSRRQIKRHWQPDKDDLHWAIKAGES